jgi:hypothetical protein
METMHSLKPVHQQKVQHDWMLLVIAKQSIVVVGFVGWKGFDS